MNLEKPAFGWAFFMSILAPNRLKSSRFGVNIAYTCSKSMKKFEIWSKYKGVFRKKELSLRRKIRR